MSSAPHVHIVDHDASRRARIASLLYGNSCHAEIYENLAELIERSPPEGIVLISDDPSKADLNGTLEAIQRELGFLPVAVLSSEPSLRRIVGAMSSGAMDFLGWPCPPSDLTDMVTRLNQVAVRIGPRERNRAKARRLVNLLSRREKDVLNGLVSGASNKEMARQLGISPRTVEIHRAAMMSRLNAQSAADAVRIGLYAGLDTSD